MKYQYFEHNWSPGYLYKFVKGERKGKLFGPHENGNPNPHWWKLEAHFGDRTGHSNWVQLSRDAARKKYPAAFRPEPTKKTLTATIACFVNVQVEVLSDATEEQQRDALLKVGRNSLNISSALIHECSNAELID